MISSVHLWALLTSFKQWFDSWGLSYCMYCTYQSWRPIVTVFISVLRFSSNIDRCSRYSRYKKWYNFLLKSKCVFIGALFFLHRDVAVHHNRPQFIFCWRFSEKSPLCTEMPMLTSIPSQRYTLILRPNKLLLYHLAYLKLFKSFSARH